MACYHMYKVVCLLWLVVYFSGSKKDAYIFEEFIITHTRLRTQCYFMCLQYGFLITSST